MRRYNLFALGDLEVQKNEHVNIVKTQDLDKLAVFTYTVENTVSLEITVVEETFLYVMNGVITVKYLDEEEKNLMTGEVLTFNKPGAVEIINTTTGLPSTFLTIGI